MRKLALVGLVVLAAAAARADAPGHRALAHDVYFTLHDASPAARQALVDACRKYLTDHEGAVLFAAGVRAEERARDVNDRDFDVSLHIHFVSEAAHEAYQKHPRHARFIEEMRSNWRRVRVFDSWVDASR